MMNTNIDGRLLFVPSQDPNFDVSSSQILHGLCNTLPVKFQMICLLHYTTSQENSMLQGLSPSKMY